MQNGSIFHHDCKAFQVSILLQQTKASTQICYKIQGHVGEKITDED